MNNHPLVCCGDGTLQYLLTHFFGRFQVDPAAFRAVLQYIYTGRLEIQVALVDDCIRLAEQFKLPDLTEKLRRQKSDIKFFGRLHLRYAEQSISMYGRREVVLQYCVMPVQVKPGRLRQRCLIARCFPVKQSEICQCNHASLRLYLICWSLIQNGCKPAERCLTTFVILIWRSFQAMP